MIQQDTDYPDPKDITLDEFLKTNEDAKRLYAEDTTNSGWGLLAEIQFRAHNTFAIETHQVAKAKLAKVQSSNHRTKDHHKVPDIDMVDCPGCGDSFPEKEMTIDHQIPQADECRQDNTNQLLLCFPCNKIKCNFLTISGLRRYNRMTGRMKSEKIANNAMAHIRMLRDRTLGPTRKQRPHRTEWPQ